VTHIYNGNKKDKNDLKEFLADNPAPPWREKNIDDGKNYNPTDDEKDIVNLALHLRRPILLGGDPGVGKSSLAKSVAYTLGCGKMLHWQITTHSVLGDGLYEYDAVGRLQDIKNEESSLKKRRKQKEIGNYLQLGALGSAFASDTMRVVLIDELDKSDIDFPNNLLHVLEEREFPIPQLARSGKSKHIVYTDDGSKKEITLVNGKLQCKVFPLIIMTSNKEREFPPAFKRRVLMHDIKLPDGDEALKNRFLEITKKHLEQGDNINEIEDKVIEIIKRFIQERKEGNQATNQLMDSVFLKLNNIDPLDEKILKKIWHKLEE